MTDIGWGKIAGPSAFRKAAAFGFFPVSGGGGNFSFEGGTLVKTGKHTGEEEWCEGCGRVGVLAGLGLLSCLGCGDWEAWIWG